MWVALIRGFDNIPVLPMVPTVRLFAGDVGTGLVAGVLEQHRYELSTI